MSENTKENCILPLEVSVKMETSARQNCDAENKSVVGEENPAEKNSTKKPEIVSADTVELNVKVEKLNSDLNITAKEEMLSTQCNAVPESDDTKCDYFSPIDVENITNTLAEKVNLTSIKPCDSSRVEETKCDIQKIKTEEDNKPERAISVDETEEENLVQTIFKLAQKYNKVRDAALTTEEIVESNRIHSELEEQDHNESNVIVKQTTDSLKNLLVYDSSSSSDEEELVGNWQFRTINKSDNDSDDLSSTSDEDDVEIAQSQSKKTKTKDEPKPESPCPEEYILKIYAENSLRDLPPIRDVSNLDIDLEKEEFLHMGHIEAVIETLITVEAIPGTPAYDLDTCLFIENETLKKPLGAIYDVIGPVASPLYCIRYQYASEISHLNVKKGMKVFCAPKTKFTRYVFVKELMKNKGTDASWVGDVEVPPEIAAQLSDDECQPEAQEPRKPQKRKHGSQERHRQFEEDMNRCNTLNSHAARLVDAQRHIPRISRHSDRAQRALFHERPPSHLFTAVFDPSVPPPGFDDFPRQRAPAMVWNRLGPNGTSRPPRWNLFGQYTGDDMGPGPGTSSHPH